MCVCVLFVYINITPGRHASRGGGLKDVGMWVERERIEWVCPSVGIIHLYIYIYGATAGVSRRVIDEFLANTPAARTPRSRCLPPPYHNPTRYTRYSRAAAAQSTVEFIAVTNGCRRRHRCRLPIISGASGFTDKCISGN